MPEQPKVARVVVFQDTSGEYRWRALAVNHEPVADSGEGYVHHSAAIEAAEALFPDAVIEDQEDA